MMIPAKIGTAGMVQRCVATLMVSCVLMVLMPLSAGAFGPPPRLLRNYPAAVAASAGTVEVADAAGNWTGVSGTPSLPAGSLIRTGPDGSATVTIGDFASVELTANTQLSLLKLRQMEVRVTAFLFLQRKISQDQIEVELQRGSVIVRITAPETGQRVVKVFTPRGAVELEPGIYQIGLDESLNEPAASTSTSAALHVGAPVETPSFHAMESCIPQSLISTTPNSAGGGGVAIIMSQAVVGAVDRVDTTVRKLSPALLCRLPYGPADGWIPSSSRFTKRTV